MKAKHGFSIIERRNGKRIYHYATRSARNFDVVEIRIRGLCHDIRFKHLPERVFEIWDGIDPLYIISVTSEGDSFSKSYLKPEYNYIKDRDYEISMRTRKNNQQTGRVRGDITNWLKAEPLERIPCKMVESSTWKASTKCVSRKLEK